jgi:hypothetical protein
MFGYITKEEDGSDWLWYQLGPANLAVSADKGTGHVTLHWKGGTDVNRLGAFFEYAARRVCTGNYRNHVSFMTREGPREFDDAPPGAFARIPNELIAMSGFVQFECLSTEPSSNPNDRRDPLIAVYANLDRHASSLQDLQESVGIYLPYDALFPGQSGGSGEQRTDPELAHEIAQVVASSWSPVFPEGRKYDQGLVLRRLEEAAQDLR